MTSFAFTYAKLFSGERNMKTTLLVLIATLTLNTVHAANGVTPNVARAHQAYLSDNGEAMLESMHQALIDSQNDPSVVKNMTDLLDKYVLENKRYPKPNFATNPVTDFLYMNSNILKRYDDQQVRYNFAVGAHLTVPQAVQSIQLVRYPSEVVIDTEAGIGDFENEDVDAYAWSEQQSSEPKLGLYTLTIKYKDQPTLNGWFILTHRNQGDRTPQIDAPSLKQTFNTATPTFKWQKFTSGHYLLTENQKVKFTVRAINEVDGKPTEKKVMDVEVPFGTKEFVVGDHSNVVSYEGLDSLSQGLYAFRLEARERSRFGPLYMVRSSISKVRFQIK